MMYKTKYLIQFYHNHNSGLATFLFSWTPFLGSIIDVQSNGNISCWVVSFLATKTPKSSAAVLR